MPTIYDNIELQFREGLHRHIDNANRVDYCVGYFNIRGWHIIADKIDNLDGDTIIEKEVPENRFCRLLVGMNKTPKESIIESYFQDGMIIDQKTANKYKKRLAEEFKEQLTIGTPTAQDEVTIRKLLHQLREGKVVVKLYLRHNLHAKLYLSYQNNEITPALGLLGSSNLTFSGLSSQGELNIDVLEQDTANKLAKWFNERWEDRWCVDITKELIEVLQTSWAREEKIPPYHIYLNIAYHLSKEARSGINKFSIPSLLNRELLDFQQKAVKIAAEYLAKRGLVLVGDVVGLGKTIVATAIAKIFEEDLYYETLILCPKNLVEMWDSYVHKYRMHAKVLSQSQAPSVLENLRRYRIVIIDESQNLRNREGQRYQAIKAYIEKNESKVILLSATPYNKSYLDLSNQLRLVISEDFDLGIAPEKYINAIGGRTEFSIRHPDTFYRSIKAFEMSDFSDDWRELMKFYMVRRTRSFIKENYARTDEVSGRKYLLFADGEKSYFPERLPCKVEFKMDAKDRNDQYAILYSQEVVNKIDELQLPRYGLGNYIDPNSGIAPTADEKETIRNLSRAGKRLMGFCRTNLFKRLESCGYAFMLSISRHVLRNYIFIYALEQNLPLPVGKQYIDFYDDDDNDDGLDQNDFSADEASYSELACKHYNFYRTRYSNQFKWLRSELLLDGLRQELADDCNSLIEIMRKISVWDSAEDRKLNAIYKLITQTHPNEKILIFSQFADTVNYLEENLRGRNVKKLAAVTGDSTDTTSVIQHFSPVSNDSLKISGTASELRILIATDVLSEGQNLQDSHVVVNADLPWAIIKLIQRAGRCDRLGQKSENIYCYSFLPEDGIEQIINLRSRLSHRIKQNAEVIGSDEVFFDGDPINIADLYSEKVGVLDGEGEFDSEVDLSSYAYQIWKNATDNDKSLLKTIPELPNVVFSAKENDFETDKQGAIIYAKTTNDNDVLTWLNKQGDVITQSQFAIINAAKCVPDTPAVDKLDNHHELVKTGVEYILNEELQSEGTLGKKSSIKYRVYMQLNRYWNENEGTLFVNENLKKAMDDIFRYPLKEAAKDTLGRQLKIGITDQQLADSVVSLREDDKLIINADEETRHKLPQIICSMGIINKED